MNSPAHNDNIKYALVVCHQDSGSCTEMLFSFHIDLQGERAFGDGVESAGDNVVDIEAPADDIHTSGCKDAT